MSVNCKAIVFYKISNTKSDFVPQRFIFYRSLLINAISLSSGAEIFNFDAINTLEKSEEHLHAA